MGKLGLLYEPRGFGIKRNLIPKHFREPVFKKGSLDETNKENEK